MSDTLSGGARMIGGDEIRDDQAIASPFPEGERSGMVAFSDQEEAVLRLHAEEVSVGRRAVQGRVQVQVRTVTREHVVDEPLTHERVEIERVAVGRPVDAIPPDRQEGDTTIISVVEEVVVVHRQLVLREEIHMRRVRVTEQHRETVSLRVQEAVVERSEVPAA